jgi:hypothetical protein
VKNSNRLKFIFPQQLKDVKFLIKKMIYSVDTECRASGSAFQGRPIESFFKRNELAISFSTLFLQQGQKRAGPPLFKWRNQQRVNVNGTLGE